MLRLSVRRKLILMVVAVVTLCAACLYGLVWHQSRVQATQQARQELDLGLAIANRTINSYREQMVMSAALLGRDPVLGRAAMALARDAVRAMLIAHASRTSAEGAWWFGANGQFEFAAKGPEGVGVSLLTEAMWQEIGRTGRASRVMTWERNGGTLLVAAAVGNSGSNGLAVFAYSLDARLTDALGALPAVQFAIRRNPPAEAADESILSKRVFLTDAYRDPVGLILTRAVGQAAGPGTTLRNQFVLAVAGVLLLAVALVWWLAGGIARSTERMHEAFRRVLSGDFKKMSGANGSDEFARLTETFNLMLEGIAQRENKVLQVAYRDPITSLPNRTLFQQRLDESLRLAKSARHSVSVQLLEIGGLTVLNDSFGYGAGEDMLCEVADRLRVVLRNAEGLRPSAKGEAASDGPTVARLDGSQFAVMLPGCNADRAAEIGGRLLNSLKTAFLIDGQAFELQGRIGQATYPEHARDMQTLMQAADVALHSRGASSPSADPGLLRVFDPAVEREREMHLSLLADLKRALEGGELFLLYQPKVSLSGATTLCVEALVRWQHPERGIQDPSVFVPFAEKTGFITVITRWVVDQALKQVATWRKQGLDIQIAINLSARDIGSDAFATMIVERLRAYNLPPNALALEVTVASLEYNVDASSRTLKILNRLGVNLMIDNFDSGFSVLSLLRSVPIDALKIDRSYVAQMRHDPGSTVIVRSMIAFGHSLGMKVVAEGVEDLPTFQLLREYGCDFAQGYYFGRPLRAADYPSWVRHQSRRFMDLSVGTDLPAVEALAGPGMADPDGAAQTVTSADTELAAVNQSLAQTALSSGQPALPSAQAGTPSISEAPTAG